MNAKVKDCLLLIARKLNRYHKILSDDEFLEFMASLDDLSDKEIGKYACRFLDLALTNQAMFLRKKNEFDDLYNLFKEYLGVLQVNYKLLALIRRYFMNCDYNVYLDRTILESFKEFDDLYRGIRVIVPQSKKHDVLECFYAGGADVYDSEFDFLSGSSDAVVYFPDDLKILVYCYELNDADDLLIKLGYNENGHYLIKKVLIKKNIMNLCFNLSSDGLMVETPEIAYVNAIGNGSISSFIEAMSLRGKFNMAKVKHIRSVLSYVSNEKEVSENGLQKIG